MICLTYKEDGKTKLVFAKESFVESALHDLVTFFMTTALLYITKNYLGNSWLALLMMFLVCLVIISKKYKTVSKEEFKEIVKKVTDEIQ